MPFPEELAVAAFLLFHDGNFDSKQARHPFMKYHQRLVLRITHGRDTVQNDEQWKPRKEWELACEWKL